MGPRPVPPEAAVFLGAVFRLLSDQGRAAGLAQPRAGAVAVIQRFGGALNLNIHIHALVLDGMFARDAAGVVGFHPARRLTTLDVAEVLAAVEPRIRWLLEGADFARMATGATPRTTGSIPGRTKCRRSLAWRRRRCRGSSRWGVTQAHAFTVLGTRVRRWTGPWAPVMPAGTGWTCMRGSSSRRGSAIGSGGSAATCYDRPSRRSGLR
jgi:hypothetical protein